jgi:hypothetical protein
MESADPGARLDKKGKQHGAQRMCLLAPRVVQGVLAAPGTKKS